MYSDLTDEELEAKITELRDGIEKVAMGGAVAVIAGEGRRKEFTRSNSTELRKLLNAALDERDNRKNGGRRGRALGVRYSR